MARVALQRELDAQKEAVEQYLKTNRQLARGYNKDIAAIKGGTQYAVRDPETNKYYLATGVNDDGFFNLATSRQNVGRRSFVAPRELSGSLSTADGAQRYVVAAPPVSGNPRRARQGAPTPPSETYPVFEEPEWAKKPDQTGGVTIAALKSLNQPSLAEQERGGLLQDAMSSGMAPLRNFKK
jgi:hypothetical protein